VSALSLPYVQRLLDLKGMSAKDNPLAHSRRLQAVVDEFIFRMAALLRERKQELDELHLPLEACLRLLAIAIDRFAKQGLSEGEWEVPDEVLTLFPEDVRPYFRPRQAAGSAASASRGARPGATRSIAYGTR
jgi:hypothetical protein